MGGLVRVTIALLLRPVWWCLWWWDFEGQLQFKYGKYLRLSLVSRPVTGSQADMGTMRKRKMYTGMISLEVADCCCCESHVSSVEDMLSVPGCCLDTHATFGAMERDRPQRRWLSALPQLCSIVTVLCAFRAMDEGRPRCRHVEC